MSLYCTKPNQDCFKLETKNNLSKKVKITGISIMDSNHHLPNEPNQKRTEEAIWHNGNLGPLMAMGKCILALPKRNCACS